MLVTASPEQSRAILAAMRAVATADGSEGLDPAHAADDSYPDWYHPSA